MPCNKIQGSADSYWAKTFFTINCNKSKWYFWCLGINNIDQHVIPTDKPLPQESRRAIVFDICNNKAISDIWTIKADNQIQNKYDDTSA